MAKSFTLGKEERLKSRKTIEKLFEAGKKFSVSSFLAYYLLVDEEKKDPLQFGVGVSGKNFKKAVDRNRIKRLTRESYRLQKLPLKESLVAQKKNLNVFFIYTGKEIPVYAEVYTAVGTIIQKLSAMVVKTK
jgi:ribonuclease P protein component